MTVKETIEMYKGQYDFVDLFVGDKFHGDACDPCDPDNCMECKAERYELMNCEEYNNSVLANTGITTDDFGWKDEKILCILISRKSIDGNQS